MPHKARMLNGGRLVSRNLVRDYGPHNLDGLRRRTGLERGGDRHHVELHGAVAGFGQPYCQTQQVPVVRGRG
jgi:hypothetical protein